MCGGECVDLGTDPNNCGMCGNDCMGDPCGAGVCQNDCGGFPDQCGASCTDQEIDPLNCGECGNVCNADQLCFNGDCRDFNIPAGCMSCPCNECQGDTDQCCFSDFVQDTVCLDAGGCP
jgi:hypothetical protein